MERNLEQNTQTGAIERCRLNSIKHISNLDSKRRKNQLKPTDSYRDMVDLGNLKHKI